MRKDRSSKTIRQRAKELRQEMTPAEKILWDKVRARRLCGLKFRRQHPIGRFIVDFYCAEKRLIIELDGLIHAEQVEQDAARTEFLNKLDYAVMRFSNAEVIDDIDSVLKRIVEHDESAASLP